MLLDMTTGTVAGWHHRATDPGSRGPWPAQMSTGHQDRIEFTMDLALSEGQKEFRSQLRAWMAEHLVGEFAAHRGVGGGSDDVAWDVRRAWERELAQGKWLGLTWTTEYGGRGLGVDDLIVFVLDYARTRPPARVSSAGHDLFGPTLLRFGTPEQKARFLPPILQVEEMWAQCFSEPGAGSDLAAVSTRAELDGTDWVINGQKVWTSFGIHADWLYALCRTAAGNRRHEGLSVLVVDAHAPGVEVRPIANLCGRSEFCEAFFTDARTPADMVIGPVGSGWSVAMGGLGIERVLPLVDEQLRFAHEVEELAAAASPRRDRARLRDLAELRVAGQVIRSNVIRILVTTGTPDNDNAALVSAGKTFWAAQHQRLARLAVDILGPESQFVGDDRQLTHPQLVRLMTLAETIYGGTAEIQKNILAERALGLPRAS